MLNGSGLISIMVGISSIIAFVISIYNFGKNQDSRLDRYEKEIDLEIRQLYQYLKEIDGRLSIIIEQHNRFLLAKKENLED